MEVDENTYPAVGFNFRVTSSDANFGLGTLTALTGFELNQTDASFQSVTGISAKLETNPYKALGSNNRQIVLPGTVTYSDLELKRGIVKKDSNIGNWCNGFLTDDQWWYFVSRKTINVFLLDNNSNDILMTWTFFSCYPIEINTGAANYGLMISSESTNSWGSGIGFKSSTDAVTKTGRINCYSAFFFSTTLTSHGFNSTGALRAHRQCASAHRRGCFLCRV